MIFIFYTLPAINWRIYKGPVIIMYDTLFIGIQHIWLGISIFLLLLFSISRTGIFHDALTTKYFTIKHLLIFTTLFSVMSVCGTYWNVEAAGGIINFRAVGIMLGGFIGGPVTGTVTGIIAGLHRAFFIHTDASYIHGGLSILQGIAAGFLSGRLKTHHRQIWLWGFFYALLLEILFWAFFALLTWPQTIANPLGLFTLSMPILITNTIATVIFIGVLEASIYIKDAEKTKTTKNAFQTVNMILDSLREGFKDASLPKITEIITTALPSLTWTAIIYKNRIYTRTAYKNQADKNEGDAEIAILKLQKSLPAMPHVLTIPVTCRNEVVGYIVAAKNKDNTFTKMGIEFLHGVCRIVEAIYEHEKMKQEKNLLAEAEIRALQAQINPHFLYNTLNTISYYVRSDPETARKLMKYLSDYFRHSLNNPSKLIPLSEEIHVVDCYIQLERTRFSDRLNVSYHFPQDSLDTLQIPPLLLQPLVENAIIHGVLGKAEGGSIRIGLIEHKKYNKIYVTDTGVGIPKEKLKTLLMDHKKRDHIGLINVHQRLISMFGEKCGLHILSREGKGTVVFTNIPKIETTEEKNKEIP